MENVAKGNGGGGGGGAGAGELTQSLCETSIAIGLIGLIGLAAVKTNE